MTSRHDFSRSARSWLCQWRRACGIVSVVPFQTMFNPPIDLIELVAQLQQLAEDRHVFGAVDVRLGAEAAEQLG